MASLPRCSGSGNYDTLINQVPIRLYVILSPQIFTRRTFASRLPQLPLTELYFRISYLVQPAFAVTPAVYQRSPPKLEKNFKIIKENAYF